MKRILFALPLTVLLTYCSSSKRVVTAPAGPGVSNVSVYNGGDTAKASTARYNTTNSVKDFGYRSSVDTTLSGSWTLEGMMATDGSWSTTSAWYPQDTALAGTLIDTTNLSALDRKALHKRAMAWKKNGGTTAATGTTNANATAKGTKTGSLDAGMNASAATTTGTAMMTDTATVDPFMFKYWQRIPMITFNPSAKIFRGNTGCNTMSGSFNFAGSDLQFNKRISTSKMACNEYNETAFLDAIKRVDSYTINGDRLELRQGTTLLLAFNRK